MSTATAKRPGIRVRIGDLAVVPDGDGYFIAIIDDIDEEAQTALVRWGDSERRLAPWTFLGAPIRFLLDSAKSLVGRRFPDLEVTRAALEPFLFVKAEVRA